MTIGLHFSPRAIELALAPGGATGDSASLLRLEFDHDLHECGLDKLEAAFALVAKTLCDRKSSRECNVALADPLTVLHVFPLQDPPEKKDLARRMAGWLGAQELGLRKEMVFDTQLLGCSEDGRDLLLGVAVDKGLLERLNCAALGAGLRVRNVNPAAVYRFNRLHDSLQDARPGMLVSLERHYWSLLLWDEQQRIRIAKSKWLAAPSTPCTPADARSIVEEWHRQMMGIAAGSGRELGTLHFDAFAADVRGTVREAMLEVLGPEADALLRIEEQVTSPAHMAWSA